MYGGSSSRRHRRKLVGGRLYFVIQQPDVLTHYLLAPWNILAVWNGGMAFFGAIILGATTLFLLAPRYGIDRFLALDAGALFALIGQPIGRLGNIINGDITGYPLSSHPISVPATVCTHAPCLAMVSDPHLLPWALVYLNVHSFAAIGIPYQPAPIYEMLGNLMALAILWPLRFALPRAKTGYFFVAYVVLYALSQLVVFFFRGSEPTTPLLGVDFLKQPAVDCLRHPACLRVCETCRTLRHRSAGFPGWVVPEPIAPSMAQNLTPRMSSATLQSGREVNPGGDLPRKLKSVAVSCGYHVGCFASSVARARTLMSPCRSCRHRG